MDMKIFSLFLNGFILNLIFAKIKCLSNCKDDFHVTYAVTYDAYLPNNVTKVIQPFGRKMCIEECKKTKVCQSANHWKQTMECQLNNDIKSTSNQLTNGEGWTYIQIEKSNSSNCSNNEIRVPLTNRGTATCVVQRCDSVLVINNRTYYVADTSIGAYTNKPCATAPGYISLGCKYVCKSTGEWTVAESNGTIKIFTTSKSWYNANTTCASQNARLLIIPDVAYYNMVKGTVEPIVSGNQYQTTCGLVTYQFWIGATDIQVEGTFKWLNGDGFSSWHTSILNADNASCDYLTPVDCILIAMHENIMHDRYCNALLPYICQKY